MIEQITDCVVEEVFNDFQWFFWPRTRIFMSLSISAADFLFPTTVMIHENASAFALAQQIKVEVTERGFIDVPKMMPMIQAFRRADTRWQLMTLVPLFELA